MFQVIKHRRHFFVAEYLRAIGYHLFQAGLVNHLVIKIQSFRQDLVEDNAADTGFNPLAAFFFAPDLNLSPEVNGAEFIDEFGFLKAAEDCAFAPHSGPDSGQVVAAEDHIQGRGHYRLAAARQQHIMDAEHRLSGFPDGGFRKGNVDRHLVAVKIGIKSSTYHRVQLDGAAVNQYRLECLDTEPVQCRSPVKQHEMLLYHFLKYVIHLRFGPFHEPPGTFYIMGDTPFQQLVHNKRLE